MASQQSSNMLVRVLWIFENNQAFATPAESTPPFALNTSLRTLMFAQFLSQKIAHYFINNFLAFLVIGRCGIAIVLEIAVSHNDVGFEVCAAMRQNKGAFDF
jgi:hypothetical protein